ncbi:SDR family oxidoreductase [Roseibium sp. SCPC15]|uniref:SDR family oxidoreductase n=1 Tax=Roseibium sp. SCP15 TaxID=3141376 RepID=UPI0033384F66
MTGEQAQFGSEQERVLITGASRGLGRELAARYAARGAHVLAGVRNTNLSDRLEGVDYFELDVTDSSSIESLDHVFEGVAVDFVINNAAIRGDDGGLDTLDDEEFLEVMRANALSALLVTRALLPSLRSGKRKVVANISSRSGSMVEGTIDDDDGDYAYRCSKAALNMVTCKLAHDLKASGITVISLHPGWIKTDMGGIHAEVPTFESAIGLMKVLDDIELSETGSFKAFDGATVAW